MSPCFLIFGLGYAARSLAYKLISDGFKVIGTSRRNTEQQDVQGVDIIHFDSPNMEEYINISTHLLISVPPTSEGNDLILEKHGNFIKKCAHHLQWIGYLSSTGVYGNHQGNWVDESSACIPHTSTGIARLKAERSWFSYAKENQLPLHVFRLSSIYGPERNIIERLKQGKKYSIFKENQVFGRIHLEDIISVLRASIQSPKPLSIYNVSDDEPASSHRVDSYAASLLRQKQLPLIPLSEANLSPMEEEFYSNNRRVSNLKIKNELKVTLQYPTYREGLKQIWKDNLGDDLALK